MSIIKVSTSTQNINVKVSAKTKPKVNAKIIPSNIKIKTGESKSKII